MALKGWRLFGVAGTIFVYVAGILFLSLASIQAPPQQRRTLYRPFTEVGAQRNRDGGSFERGHTPNWCTPMHFRNITVMTAAAAPPPPPPPPPLPSPASPSAAPSAAAASASAAVTGVTHKLPLAMTKPVALASFPGSGNTWLRYLLQQATGVYTGSVYRDFGLLKSGFPGENIYNTSVLVVKTHEWGKDAFKQFDKAVLLIRDPDKAILAEFNRQSGGHVGFASPDRYKRTKGRYWQQFVYNKIMGWEQMNVDWSIHFHGPIKIIFYDDLVNNVMGTLREILEFIEFPVDEELLTCAASRREGIYRRKKRIMPFDPFSPTMRMAINKKRDEVYARIKPNLIVEIVLN